MNFYILIFIIYLIFINIISFFITGYDKYLAKNNKMRISENSLFTLAIIFGGLGVYIGMYKFRHKTKHVKFTIGIPIIIVINILLAYYLISHVLYIL